MVEEKIDFQDILVYTNDYWILKLDKFMSLKEKLSDTKEFQHMSKHRKRLFIHEQSYVYGGTKMSLVEDSSLQK